MDKNTTLDNDTKKEAIRPKTSLRNLSKKENLKYIFLAVPFLIVLVATVFFIQSDLSIIDNFKRHKAVRILPPTDESKEEPTEEEENNNTQEEVFQFETGYVTNQSNGFLYLMDKPNYKENDYQSLVFFVFKDSDTGKSYTLTNNLSIESNTVGVYLSVIDPILINNEIYFLHRVNEGYYTPQTLKKLNINNGTLTEIELQSGEKKSLQSFFVQEDNVYYLTGQDCRSYMEKCNLELKSYNMKTKDTQLLTENLSSRNILGFNSQGTELILNYWDGDAGCLWGTFEKYNIVSKVSSVIDSYNFCYDLNTGELVTQKDKEQETKFKNMSDLVSGVKTLRTILISNGIASSPSQQQIEENDFPHSYPISLTY